MSATDKLSGFERAGAGHLAGLFPPAAPLDAGARRELRDNIARLVLANLRWLLGRQRDSYPFIDTKIDLTTGADFDATDPLRGRETIFTWIQGRGLEALAGHLRWAEDGADGPLASAIRPLLVRVIRQMEMARGRNGGRLPFMMRRDGRRLSVTADGVATSLPASGGVTSLSDLFYAKGLMAAASVLGDDGSTAAARGLFDDVISDLHAGRFRFGQEALDPKNPVAEVPGRFSHAGRMIGIGAATVFYRCTGEARHRELGLEFIRWILERHTSRETGDFWEFTGVAGKPWADAVGRVWSDPGHATEFTGLAFAHLYETGTCDARLEARLRKVLRQNFANGFAATAADAGLGIAKAYDLAARRPINTDMPWWSLPETMRAAALGALTADGGREARELERMLVLCWNAFAQNFVRRDHTLLAVQNLAVNGTMARAIPATPDADPGYHTGLSLIGCFPWLDAPPSPRSPAGSPLPS
jgi:hypothetical protein